MPTGVGEIAIGSCKKAFRRPARKKGAAGTAALRKDSADPLGREARGAVDCFGG